MTINNIYIFLAFYNYHNLNLNKKIEKLIISYSNNKVNNNKNIVII